MYIIEDILMKIAKWGNSLAVRLPKDVVDELELKSGDKVVLRIDGRRTLMIARDRSREEVLDELRALQRPLPPGFKFDRDDANER